MSADLEILKPILAKVSSCISDLVGPVINRGVQGDVEAYITLVHRSVVSGPMRDCLHAGLWVLAGDLDRAHRICQEVETPHGAAWHAMVHRREGDFWNSKYWWRRAGGVKFENLAATLRDQLASPAPEIGAWLSASHYDPAGFVDLVERFADRADLRDQLVAVQRLEWAALFEECWAG
jgi:hypothetical protein